MSPSMSEDKYLLESLGIWTVLGFPGCFLANQWRSTGQKGRLELPSSSQYASAYLHFPELQPTVSPSADNDFCATEEFALLMCLVFYFFGGTAQKGTVGMVVYTEIFTCRPF